MKSPNHKEIGYLLRSYDNPPLKCKYLREISYGGVGIAGVVTSGEPTPGLVPVGVFRGRRTLDLCFLGPPVSPSGLVGAPERPRGLAGALARPNGAAGGENITKGGGQLVQLFHMYGYLNQNGRWFSERDGWMWVGGSFVAHFSTCLQR